MKHPLLRILSVLIVVLCLLGWGCDSKASTADDSPKLTKPSGHARPIARLEAQTQAILPPGLLASLGWRGYPGLVWSGSRLWLSGVLMGFYALEEGTVVDSWTRKGQGPGEFLFLDDLAISPDMGLSVWDGHKNRLMFYDVDPLRFREERTLPKLPGSIGYMRFLPKGHFWVAGNLGSAPQPEAHGMGQAPLGLLKGDGSPVRLLQLPWSLPPGMSRIWPTANKAFLLGEDLALAGSSLCLGPQARLTVYGPDLVPRQVLTCPNPGSPDLDDVRKGRNVAEYTGADAPHGYFLVEFLVCESLGNTYKPFHRVHCLFDRSGALLDQKKSNRHLIRSVQGDRGTAYFTYDVDELQIYRHPLP